MKKLSVFLILVMLLTLSACQSEGDSIDSYGLCPANSQFASGDAEIVSTVSRDVFTESIVCSYNGSTITIHAPIYTGLPVESVYSYKQNYSFENGAAVFWAALENGAKYYLIDKAGKIISDDYTVTAADSITIPDYADGGVRGNGVDVIQTGTPGAYQQQLCSMTGEILSDQYDSIGYFYNGLALVTKDNKVGLIDEQGNAVLEPTIAYDEIIYPPKNTGYDLVFMWGDAFVIPINGEFAIITIER